MTELSPAELPFGLLRRVFAPSGQVTLPADMRQAVGIVAGDYVEVTVSEDGKSLVITPTTPDIGAPPKPAGIIHYDRQAVAALTRRHAGTVACGKAAGRRNRSDDTEQVNCRRCLRALEGGYAQPTT